MVGSKLVERRKDAKVTRRYFDEQTKREAIEALLSGEKTRAELCKELEIQPSQLLAWMGHYAERKKAYAEIEAASSAGTAAAGLGEALAGALGGGIADRLPAGARGALQDEIAKAVGHAVLKMLAEVESKQ